MPTMCVCVQGSKYVNNPAPDTDMLKEITFVNVLGGHTASNIKLYTEPEVHCGLGLHCEVQGVFR